jgi:hypothetical protein
MPVVEAVSREGHGNGALPGGAEHAVLLAIPGDPVALEVCDVGRQRRRAEGPPLMADHPGLDDGATVSGEQTAAGERPNAKRLPRDHPSLRHRIWSDTRLLPGAQNRVDETLSAASIADAPHQDVEFVGRCSRGSLGYFRMVGAEKDLEKSGFWPSSGTADRPPPRGKPSNDLAPRWGVPVISQSCCRYLTTAPNPAQTLRLMRCHDEAPSFKVSAGIAGLSATRTGRRRAAEWPSDGPSERRTFARGHEVRRLPDGRSAIGRMVVT